MSGYGAQNDTVQHHLQLCPIVARVSFSEDNKRPWRFQITSSLISGLHTAVTLQPDVHLPLGYDRHQGDYHLNYQITRLKLLLIWHKHASLVTVNSIVAVKEVQANKKREWTVQEVEQENVSIHFAFHMSDCECEGVRVRVRGHTSESSLWSPSWRTALGDFSLAWLDWAICRFNCQPTYSSCHTHIQSKSVILEKSTGF